MTSQLDRDWVARLQAAGKAQARYLWILLVSCIFYLALSSRLAASAAGSAASLTVPFVDLELGAYAVLASGPAVLSFLVLAIMGAIRAYTHASHHLHIDKSPGAAEKLDVHPNAIDLAAYTTSSTPHWIATTLYFSYPLFVVLALLEAAWLWVSLASDLGLTLSAPVALLAVAIPLWLGAGVQVADSVRKRIAKARQGGHLRKGDAAKKNEDGGDA